MDILLKQRYFFIDPILLFGMEGICNIAIDCGTSVSRIGFAGKEEPELMIPSIVGRPKYANNVIDKNFLFVGNKAYKNMSVLDCDYPINGGSVTNWDDMEHLCEFMYSELGVEPENYGVLMTEQLNNTKNNREKLMQLMFETFNVPSYFVGLKNYLSLISCGMESGIDFHCGDSITSICPIINSMIDIKHNSYFEFGGRDISYWLQKCLEEKIEDFISYGNKKIINTIKEKYCYIARDYNDEIQKIKSDKAKKYDVTLPDGNVINMQIERIKCTELFFKPEIEGLKFEGINKFINETIRHCDLELQKMYYSNIVISGGSIQFEGFKERLTSEIENLVDENTKVHIIKHHDANISSWIGESILGSLASYNGFAITRKEYKEEGKDVVNHRCNYSN